MLKWVFIYYGFSMADRICSNRVNTERSAGPKNPCVCRSTSVSLSFMAENTLVRILLALSTSTPLMPCSRHSLAISCFGSKASFSSIVWRLAARFRQSSSCRYVNAVLFRFRSVCSYCAGLVTYALQFAVGSPALHQACDSTAALGAVDCC